MPDRPAQRKPPQRVESATPKVGDHHLMPGLIEPLVSAFDAPRKHLTTRGVAREKRVAETFVVTAILRDMRRDLNELRGMISRRPVASESVREFRMYRTGGAA